MFDEKLSIGLKKEELYAGLCNSLERFEEIEQEKLQTQAELRTFEEKKDIIEAARHDFWPFCKALQPEYYYDDPDKDYLYEACIKLQAFYERRIVRFGKGQPWQIITPEQKEALKSAGELYQICRKFIWNMPPQLGKSRTLVLFCQWCFGQNVRERILTCSYNDDLAQDFSRYTRDGIDQKKELPGEIVFSDIFPNVKMKKGNASYEKWALAGQFFSYKGAGLGGSITGKGGTIRIVDDPIKDAKTAYNENALDDIWKWLTGTFLSRGSGLPLDIYVMTRWASKDPVGRMLEGPRKDDYYCLIFEAVKPDGTMLCEKELPRERYEDLKDTMDEAIFEANYHQKPVDIKGRLYQNLQEYDDIPRDGRGIPLFERIINYTDTADEGDDFLASIVAGIFKGQAWILDVLYTQDPMEKTEPATADMLFHRKVNQAKIESNNGGKGFARNVRSELWDRHQSRYTDIEWFHQTENKKARILTNASYITKNVFFPAGWETKWPAFYKAIITYQKEGKNAHDDVPDAITGIAEMITGGTKGLLDFMRQQAEEARQAKEKAEEQHG